MLIEIVGLPGSGKSTLIQALSQKGMAQQPTFSHAKLLLSSVLGALLHPVGAVSLLARVAVRSRGMRRYAFINAVLYPLAYSAQAFMRPVVTEHGFLQGLLSFPPRTMQSAARNLPRPDLVIYIETPAAVRETRLKARGWEPRQEFGATAVLELYRQQEEFLPRLMRERPGLVLSGEDTIETQVARIRTALDTIRRTHGFRAGLKTFALFISAMLSRALRFGRGPQAVVLMYHAVDRSHYILSVTPEQFERQIAYLTARKKIVPLADIVRHAQGASRLGNAVALTFDDGYRDILTTVLPVLKVYKVPATVFVPTDLVRTDPLHTPRMSFEEMRAAAASGLVSFESHGKTHRRLPALSHKEMLAEARESADVLKRELGIRPKYFAYPYGDKSAAAAAAVHEAGYSAAFGITAGEIRQGDDLYLLKRVQADASSFAQFRFRLEGSDIHRIVVRALRTLALRLFDWHKKREMDKQYGHEKVWGRETHARDIDAAVKLLPQRRYKRCLDIGTGLGSYAEAVSPLCDSILAIDISERAVTRARKRLRDTPSIEFRTENIRTFYSAESYDLVIVGDMLYYLGDSRFPEEFEALVSRIAGYVAPGGRLLISNVVRPWIPTERSRSYVRLFERHGLALEREELFEHDGKKWIQSILQRP